MCYLNCKCEVAFSITYPDVCAAEVNSKCYEGDLGACWYFLGAQLVPAHFQNEHSQRQAKVDAFIDFK